MIFLRIIEIIFPIFAIVSVGILYGRLFRPDMTLPNRLIMDVFLPCLLFSVLTDRAQEAEIFGSFALAIAFVVLGSGLIAFFIARLINLSAKTFCPPIMFSNAGNLGLPLIVLTFGNVALPTAVVMFIVCNFLHITIGNYMLDKEPNPLKVLLSPIIIAVLIALVLSYMSVSVNQTLMEPIRMMGNICVPLMLFALGVRLLDTDLSEWRLGILVAVLSPLVGVVLVLLVSPFLELNRLQQGALFLFGTLPPAVMNFIFAEHYDQEPSRVAAMVLFGNTASIIVLPLALLYVLPNFS